MISVLYKDDPLQESWPSESWIDSKTWKQLKCPQEVNDKYIINNVDNRILFGTKNKWSIKPWQCVKET